MSTSSGGSLVGCADDSGSVTLRRFISRTHSEIVDGIRHDLYHLAILPFLNNANQTQLPSASSVSRTDVSFLTFKKIWIQNKLSLIHHACPQRCDRETYLQLTAYAVYGLLYHRFKQENSILRIPIDLNQLLPAVKDEVVRETVYNIAFIYTLFCVFHTQIVTNDNLYESKKYTARGKAIMKGAIKTDALLNKTNKILRPFRLGFSDMKEISQSIDNISFLAPIVGKQALILWHQLLLANSFHYCLESGPHHGNRWYNQLDLTRNSHPTSNSLDPSLNIQQAVNAEMNVQQEAITERSMQQTLDIDSSYRPMKAKAMEAVKRLLERCTVMATDDSGGITNKTKALTAVQKLLALCTDIDQSPIRFAQEQSELHQTPGLHSRKKRAIDAVNVLLKIQPSAKVGAGSSSANSVVIHSVCNYRLQLRRWDVNPNAIISRISDNFINSQVYHDNSLDVMLQNDALYASHVLEHGSISENSDSAVLDVIKLKRKNYYEFKHKWGIGKDAGASRHCDDIDEEKLGTVIPGIRQENGEDADIQTQEGQVERAEVSNHPATPTMPTAAPTTRALPVTTELQHSVNPNFADEFMASLIGPTVAEAIHSSTSNSTIQESMDANNALEQLVKTMSNVESSSAYSSKWKGNTDKKERAIAAVQKLLDASTPFSFPTANKQGTSNTKQRSNSSIKSTVNKPVVPVTSGVSVSRRSDASNASTNTSSGPTIKGNMWKKINAIDSVSKLLQQATAPGNVHVIQTSRINATDTSRVNAADTSRINTADTSRINAADTSRINTAETSRINATDTSRINAADTSRINAADTSRINAADTSNNREETQARLLLRELEANMNGFV